MTRILVCVADPRRRLHVLDSLREIGEIETLAAGETPVRAARRGAFGLVVLDLGADVEGGIAACRALRSDFGHPAPVLLLDPHGRLDPPERGLGPGLAAGVVRGRLEAAALRAVCREVLGGTNPVRTGPLERRWRLFG